MRNSVVFQRGTFSDVPGGPSAREQDQLASWAVNWFKASCPPKELTKDKFIWLRARFGLTGLGSEPSIRDWWSKWCKTAEGRTWMVETIVTWAVHVAGSADEAWSPVEEAVGLALMDRELVAA